MASVYVLQFQALVASFQGSYVASDSLFLTCLVLQGGAPKLAKLVPISPITVGLIGGYI